MRLWSVCILMVAAILAMTCATAQEEANPLILEKDTGYRGIWYFNQKTDTEYVYKYSGGLGTYCAKHIPLAVYAPEVNKTFFVYGGTAPDDRRLLAEIGYYDHATGTVPRPTLLLDKKTDDAHDNPVLSIDDNGYLWVFVSSHGKGRPSYILKSRQPHDIDDFELVETTNFSYPQPWHIPGKGFVFMLTSYDGGRVVYCQTSPDGRTWSGRQQVAFIDEGHYQTSWPWGERIGTTFNYHPKAFGGDSTKKGLNWRTNLYYVQSGDLGKTWTNVRGEALEVPLTTPDNAALVVDYQAQGLLAYMKDLNYDAEGNPIILHLTAKSWEPGPEYGPREWRTARWTGDAWDIRVITSSGNNYDTGCLHVENDGTWRVIGPSELGPQPYNPGGEMVMWTSENRGETWERVKQLTHDSPYNHTYARRPVNAHPGFYAYWADGHGRQPSDSRLYFCDKDGNVFRLPYVMDGDSATPEKVE